MDYHIKRRDRLSPWPRRTRSTQSGSCGDDAFPAVYSPQEERMAKSLLSLLAGAFLLPLLSCGGSQHSPDEKYFLIATNIKVPYWQHALAGVNRAASQLQVRAELTGPDTYD